MVLKLLSATKTLAPVNADLVLVATIAIDVIEVTMVQLQFVHIAESVLKIGTELFRISKVNF